MTPDSVIHDRLCARLRRSPTRFTVSGSLPVLFFGELLSATVATIGLNPSAREYVDRHGKELDGLFRRFETEHSLGVTGRHQLTSEQCDQAIETMRSYYRPGKPVYSWFRSLERVLSGMGVSYVAGEAAHLDLVQEATHPTWSALKVADSAETAALLAADTPFLLWQLRSFPLRAVVCNGRTVFDAVCTLTGAKLVETGKFARLTWNVATTEVGGRTMAVVGWNFPLARATGLDKAGHVELGRLLSKHLPER